MISNLIRPSGSLRAALAGSIARRGCSASAQQGGQACSSVRRTATAGTKRNFCSSQGSPGTRIQPKEAVQEPPPPPVEPNTGGGGGMLPLVLLGGAAGAAYYYQEELKEQLGMGGEKVDDTGMSASSLKKEIEQLGVKIALEEAAEKAAAHAKAEQLAVASMTRKQPDMSKPPTPAPSKPAETAAKEATNAVVDWKQVREAIVDILDEEGYDDGSIGPLLVRLAWHAAGTYDKNTKRGGTEGACMRFENGNEASWGANAGLAEARSRLEPIKQKFEGITYSDLWSFAGTVALEEMGGMEFNWRPGRKDFDESMNNLPDGLLPDADGRGEANPADHLRDIFGRMGFNDKEIVCLSGAHSLGRCHPDRSGFINPWTRAPTTFAGPEYFRLLLEETWSRKQSHEGKEWKGPLQFENSETGSDLMMLETDLALVRDPKMKPYVELYAKDSDVFEKDFKAAWIKLQELGVRRFHGRRRYYFFGPRE